MTIARFRANPEKIRVSICSHKSTGYRATVTERSSGDCVTACSPRAEEAVDWALRYAEDIGLDGVDIECDWAYPHPQHPERT